MRFFIFIACLFYSISSYAQVNITVKNTQNQILPGASVSYNSSGTVTDSNGKAQLPNLENGTLVTVSFIGYKDKTQKYNGVDMLFTLEPEETLLAEVIITSQLPRATEKTPMSFHNITKAELTKSNLGKDIPMLLEGSPSLVTSSDAGAGVGYTNFRVRGTSTERINVTVNGVPLNDSESHSVYWVNIPDIASATKNIQIQRGVGTSSNGAASFGATLNLETEDFNKEAYAKVGLSGGSFNTFRQNYQVGTGLIGDHFTIDAKYSDIYSSGYMDRAFSDLKSYYVSTAYHGADFLIKLLAFGGEEHTYQAWSGVPSSMIDENRTYNPEGEYTDDNGTTQYYDNHTDNYKQNHYQLYFSKKFNPYWNLNATLHYTRGKGFYESYKEGRKFKNYGIELPMIGNTDAYNSEYIDGNVLEKTDLIQQKWLDNDFYGLVASAQYKKDQWDVLIGGSVNHYEGGHFGEVIWSKYGFFPHDYRWYNNDGTKDEFSSYVKANYQLANGLNLFGDLQYRQIEHEIEGIHDDLRDISQTHEYNFFNPKFGITYIPNSNFRSYASWGRAHREPSRTQLKDVTADIKTPKEERLDDFELGLEYKTTTWRIGGNIYYMLYKDQLIHTGAINNVGDAIMTNVEDSYRAGIELEAGIQFTDSFKWSGNATFSKNEAKDFTAYMDNWDTWGQEVEEIGTTTLAFSPEVVANSIFTVTPFDNFEIALHSNYVGEQFLDNTANDDRKLDDYFVNNLQFHYSLQPKKWFKYITFNLQLKNILDEEYETNGWVYRYVENNEEKKMDGLFPQAGFHVMGGITFNF
ncbi:iron complex outermembrane receptor protein [Balneicella halophila]|uniref:Iron complex outermembrane receptor protein n=1 Tax=Balneicella halophila TaxID=1537566 RepID=A0A7L4URA7_BALHA|nr:TonB-dependent receptor [Balneicella halophila]PVX52305.1 iron complex outermembrane receptor protein [Balneicella halophila]